MARKPSIVVKPPREGMSFEDLVKQVLKAGPMPKRKGKPAPPTKAMSPYLVKPTRKKKIAK